MFAVITPALMTGAFADRLRFAPYLLFISLWIVLVYAPFCHWIWGPGGWMGAQTRHASQTVHRCPLRSPLRTTTCTTYNMYMYM